MVPEASKPVMMGEAGKGGLLDFLVSIGGFMAQSRMRMRRSCGEGVGIWGLW